MEYNVTPEQQDEVGSYMGAIRTVSGVHRLICIGTLETDHGEACMTLCNNYPEDESVDRIAEDLIRALATLYRDKRINIEIGGKQVAIGQAMSKDMADLIFGKIR